MDYLLDMENLVNLNISYTGIDFKYKSDVLLKGKAKLEKLSIIGLTINYSNFVNFILQ